MCPLSPRLCGHCILTLSLRCCVEPSTCSPGNRENCTAHCSLHPSHILVPIQVKRTEDAYNALFWGSGAQEGDIISSKQPSFQFSGGRLTAHQAGTSSCTIPQPPLPPLRMSTKSTTTTTSTLMSTRSNATSYQLPHSTNQPITQSTNTTLPHSFPGLEYIVADARHVVWLDANLDGALDVLLLGKPSDKFTQEIVGSELYLSQGPGSRHWKLGNVISQLVELTSTAILTDIDGTAGSALPMIPPCTLTHSSSLTQATAGHASYYFGEWQCPFASKPPTVATAAEARLITPHRWSTLRCGSGGARSTRH